MSVGAGRYRRGDHVARIEVVLRAMHRRRDLAERDAAADELTAEAQRLGLGY